jgi:hypothetical protein
MRWLEYDVGKNGEVIEAGKVSRSIPDITGRLVVYQGNLVRIMVD